MSTGQTRQGPRAEYLSDPKVVALRAALRDRDPFYTGICAVPEDQRHLYYTDESEIHRRIDFSNVGSDDLDALYRACKPAEFGRNGENVFDESYRKAGKMDLVSFATALDPRSLGIHEQVSKALLTQSHAMMELELYKLNVYGKGDFFKAHKDTPRGETMFGSLVVVLPTRHEGSQFVLRQSKEWTIDFTDKFANTTEPSVCFIAFYGDIEHEVSPITSGYRVTLTYNLYHKPIHPTTSSIPTPFYLSLRQALADLVNDTSKLPNGGYLGFGLVHEYVHTGRNRLGSLEDQLKGSDRALADACDALGLPYSIRLLYRGIVDDYIHLLTTTEVDVSKHLYEASFEEYLTDALKGLTQEQVEGVVFVEQPLTPCLADYEPYLSLGKYYKDPMTNVMEITRMQSSVDSRIALMTYGNEAQLEYFYGTACMLIAVGPAESRRPVNV